MIEQTLAAIGKHFWNVVLLAPRAKYPVGDSWDITQSRMRIRSHYLAGGNLGLVCGPDSRVLALDFDKPGVLAEMCTELGPILPWVVTGRGGYHCYFKWEDGLPAKIQWRGERVGEVQRGPSKQHVVVPPSVHPDTGKTYEWALDPTGDLPAIPTEWREHLVGEATPSFIEHGSIGHPEDEPWAGPSPEEILHRAAQQPGARRRRHGIKFQCRGCLKEGHDKSRDNAIVYPDGRWGCAVDQRHTRDIGEQLGVVSVTREVLGDSDELRDVSPDDLD